MSGKKVNVITHDQLRLLLSNPSMAPVFGLPVNNVLSAADGINSSAVQHAMSPSNHRISHADMSCNSVQHAMSPSSQRIMSPKASVGNLPSNQHSHTAGMASLIMSPNQLGPVGIQNPSNQHVLGMAAPNINDLMLMM